MVRLDATAGRLEALVAADEWAARDAATADLSANEFGVGRELFGAFRRFAGTAEAGASIVG